jgi:hypothetical protein
VPEGYTLYIDGQASNQIYKSDALGHVYLIDQLDRKLCSVSRSEWCWSALGSVFVNRKFRILPGSSKLNQYRVSR